jgi:hypothetical protein
VDAGESVVASVFRTQSWRTFSAPCQGSKDFRIVGCDKDGNLFEREPSKEEKGMPGAPRDPAIRRLGEARSLKSPNGPSQATTARSNTHNTDAVPCSILSSVDPQIIQFDSIHTDDLIDDIPARETLPSA